ncbi:MAG: DUF4253 domain-containing protein [Deltaproteobacteria bacterium]|nr:DUF4253 domain-containing protein [Deltaproteobacteria bacterium]
MRIPRRTRARSSAMGIVGGPSIARLILSLLLCWAAIAGCEKKSGDRVPAASGSAPLRPSAGGPPRLLPAVPSSSLPPAVVAAVGRPVEAVRVAGRGTTELLGFRVSSAEALAVWQKVHAVKEQSGSYPVVFAGEADLLHLPGEPHPDPAALSPEATLRRAAGIHAGEWLRQRPGELGLEPPRDPAASGRPNDEFLLFDDIVTRRPREDLVLLLVPTTKAWEVPAYLAFGGWNDCPTDDIQIAVQKRWFDSYGAELVAMDTATMELRVARPPTTREAALALATEQFAYCYDIVDQGVGSLDALAASLRNAHVWFFWWD